RGRLPRRRQVLQQRVGLVVDRVVVFGRVLGGLPRALMPRLLVVVDDDRRVVGDAPTLAAQAEAEVELGVVLGAGAAQSRVDAAVAEGAGSDREVAALE